MKLLVSISFLLLTQIAYGQFEPQKTIAQQLHGVHNTHFDDVDNDGDMDVLACTWLDNRVVWFENDGLGNFSNFKSITDQTANARSVFTADLDNDGDVDVISASSADDKIAWYENFGNGEFGVQNVLTTSLNYPTFAYASDIDSDGYDDIIAVASTGTTLAWFQNLGNGTFSAPNIIDNNVYQAYTVTTADIDNDLDQDIFVGNDDNVIWYENLGGGNFGTANTITTLAFDVKTVRVMDLDGDLDLDIISASAGDDKIAWYENLGGASFGPQQVISTLAEYVWDISVGDLDNDGDLDIASSSGTDNEIAWYENLGGASFGAQQILSTNFENARSVDIVDLDNDGFKDIVGAAYTNERIGWFKNSGGGFSTEKQVNFLGMHPNATHFGDFNNDGYDDILMGSDFDGVMACYLNDGIGNFPYQTIIDEGFGTVKGVYASDVDGDGYTDVLVAGGSNNSFAWYKNNGGTTFSAAQILDNNSLTAYYVRSGDLDNDGDLDIVGASANDNTICWFENLGGGSFSAKQVISSIADYVVDLDLADLDGDGLLDILAACYDNNQVIWHKNNGGGSFNAESVISSTAMAAKGVTHVDLDSDGDWDVISASVNDNTIQWFENDGLGNFISANVISTAVVSARFAEPVDLNSDGNMDIVAIGSSSISYFLNYGGATFGPENLISNNLNLCRSLSITDLDNDGDLDAITGSWGDRKVAVYKNTNFYNALVSGYCYVDVNQNQQFDAGDVGMDQTQINSTPQSDFTFSNSNGFYGMNFSDSLGTYILAPQSIPSSWDLTSDSLSYTVTIDTLGTPYDSLNFGFYPNSMVDSINVEIVSSPSKCDNEVNYWLYIQNLGTTTPSGLISLQLDDSITYVSSSPIHDSIIGQTIYWSYDTLNYFTSDLISLSVLMPDFNSMGDTLTSVLAYNITNGGPILFSAMDTLSQVLTCAYDPNDKIVSPIGYGVEHYIHPESSYLEYTVRFQNTGNDTASVVLIKDQLDPHLIWSSLTPLASSHDLSVTVDQFGEVSFLFDNIMLPDSNVNQLGSQGFVKYRISIDTNAAPGNAIENTAHIFFDSNPAVITNTAISTLYDCAQLFSNISLTDTSACEGSPIEFISTETFNLFDWHLNSNPTENGTDIMFIADSTGLLYVTGTNPFCDIDTTVSITALAIPEIQLGMIDDTICVQSGIITLSGSTPIGGTYSGLGVTGNSFDPAIAGIGSSSIAYTYTDANGCTGSYSVLVTVDGCADLPELNEALFKIYPNPTQDQFIIEIDDNMINSTIQITDSFGKIVFEEQLNDSLNTIEIQRLNQGVYYIRLGVKYQKLLIQK